MSDDRPRWEDRYATRHVADAVPSAFLVAHAARIYGRVLDVAAGAGRNALFLARRGHAVDAIDISLNALRTARGTAAAEGLRLSAVQADLESFPLPRDCYGAVINLRYLQRSLFGALQHTVKPGGIILFETFLIDQQRIGHPSNPQYLLDHGELRAAFAECDILEYEEGLFDEPTQHAYLARLLARRPLRQD